MALINLRNALMAGKRLPYDAEVEYLQSTGTQWVDTGVMYAVNHSYDVKSDLMVKSANQLNGWNAGGCFGSDSTGNYSIGTGGSIPIIDKYVHSELLINSGSSSQTVANYLVDGTAYSISRNHENLASYAGADGFPLFACKSKGSLTYLGTVRFYACQIYVNSILVRDFIPVRKGTVGYMYDRVSGKLFGNQGTGDFVLGPDVVPVEYIESHGTEWIDTGVDIANSDDARFVITCTITNTVRSNSSTWVGSGVLSTGSLHYVLDNRGIRTGGGDISTAIPYNRGDVVTIDVYYDSQHRRTCKIGQSIYQGTAYNASTAKLAILNYPAPTNVISDQHQAGKLFHVEVYKSGTLVRDFTPVRVGNGSTWEGAMMDVLTRRVYRNAGTGAFGYGNDLKYPIPAE